MNDMKLYKFRPLADCEDLKKIKDIVENGFYCCDFLSFNDTNEGVFSINKNNIDIPLVKKLQYKICSFSKEKALKSQLMWGHYANAGMGVVIEVEVNNCMDIQKVIYDDEVSNSDDIVEILTRKSEVWQYEYECRYIKKNKNKRIFKNNIKKIYFGTPYEGLSNKDEIKDSHKYLKKYHKLKCKLKKFCNDKYRCEDYSFDNLVQHKNQ